MWDAATGRELCKFVTAKADVAKARAASQAALTAVQSGGKPSAAQEPDFRVWTDITRDVRIKETHVGHISSRVHTDALFLGVVDRKVRLKKRDSTVIEMPIGLLSPADKDYIESREPDRKPDTVKRTFSIDLEIQSAPSPPSVSGLLAGVSGNLGPTESGGRLPSEQAVILLLITPILDRIGYTLQATPEQARMIHWANEEIRMQDLGLWSKIDAGGVSPRRYASGWKTLPRAPADKGDGPLQADLQLRISASFSTTGKNPLVSIAKWELECRGVSGGKASVAGNGQYSSRGTVSFGPGYAIRSDGVPHFYTPRGGRPVAYEPGPALGDGGFTIRFAKAISDCTGIPEKDVLLAAMESEVRSARDKVPFVRAQASWWLVQLGDFDYIRAMWDSSYEGVIDESAATKDGRFGVVAKFGEKVVPRLIALLCDEDDPGYSADVLGRIGKPAVPALIEVVRGGRYAHRAAYALAEIKDPRAIESLIAAAKDTGYLAKAGISDQDRRPGDWKRKQVIYALQPFRAHPAARKTLKEIAERDPSSECREAAVATLTGKDPFVDPGDIPRRRVEEAREKLLKQQERAPSPPRSRRAK